MKKRLSQLLGKTKKVKGFKTSILQVSGCGFISAALWTVWMPLGLLAIGVSLFILEYLSNGDGK